MPGNPEDWLQAGSSFFPVGQFAFIPMWENKGFPLSAAHGTGDMLRRTGLLCSKQAAPAVLGPLFLLSKESVHCLLALGLMSGAKCRGAVPFGVLDSFSHSPTLVTLHER